MHMKIPLDSVVLSKPSSDSCHTSGAGQCMCISETFAAPGNNEGEEKIVVFTFVGFCFSSETFFKKGIIKVFMFSNLAWVKVTEV